MRRVICGILCIVMMLGLATTAFAAISGDEVKTYNTPFLITNAGQGPGGKMARLLVSQTGTLTLDTDYFYDSEPGAEGHGNLDDMEYSCLVVVIGSTDKGLGASGITIEDDVRIAANVQLISNNHDPYDLPVLLCKPVHIKASAWIGAGATILPGVCVGRHAVVGAGSVVTKDVPDYAVVVGNPARVVKMLDKERFSEES